MMPMITDNAMCGAAVSGVMANDLLGSVTIKCGSPLYGRYIYVNRPSALDDPDILYLCEVQAFGKGKNYSFLTLFILSATPCR